jgi:superoxide dismutase, Cu-Zn family
MKTRTLLALLAMALLSGAVAGADDDGIVTATATLAGCTNPAITGRAVLIERPSAEGVKVVEVALTVSGLTPGKHAVHIHEAGACTPCAAALGHFDPGPASNPSPDGNHPFHTGDLINVNVNSRGNGVMHATTSRITLSPGPLSLFDANGSAFIVHDGSDTYCPAGAVAGCAGGTRAACGVITLRE